MGITHSWNGTVLTITSDSGTSAMDLQGTRGEMGPRGPQGPKGDCAKTDDELQAAINNYMAGQGADEAYIKTRIEEVLASYTDVMAEEGAY